VQIEIVRSGQYTAHHTQHSNDQLVVNELRNHFILGRTNLIKQNVH
jgi:hypothetical protein